MNYQRELDFAREIAVAAGANARRIRECGIVAESKADESPVTAADKDNERLLREAIEREFPDDGILGEEGASKPGTSGRRWIVDPIDGTRDFVLGNRFWCVLVGLESGDDSLVGVAHFPMLDETYSGAQGAGAYLGAERIRVSDRASVRQCAFNPNGLQLAEARPHIPAVLELVEQSWAVRSYGGALDGCLLAAGKVDIWFEPKVAPWDLAALRPIIEEAGGLFFALDGSRSIYRGSVLACVPALAADVRRAFRVPAVAHSR